MATTTNLLLPLLLVSTLILFSLLIHPSESTVIHRRSTKSNPKVAVAQLLNGHNSLRAGLNLPPLQWNTTLTRYAKWWANQRRGDCALIHSNSDYGENIFWGQGGGWTASDAVNEWAAEKSYYNYGSNTCMPNKDCTHYTQMVWRTTTFLGCAKIKCTDGDTYVVCEYYPHGNVIGQRPY